MVNKGSRNEEWVAEEKQGNNEAVERGWKISLCQAKVDGIGRARWGYLCSTIGVVSEADGVCCFAAVVTTHHSQVEMRIPSSKEGRSDKEIIATRPVEEKKVGTGSVGLRRCTGLNTSAYQAVLVNFISF